MKKLKKISLTKKDLESETFLSKTKLSGLSGGVCIPNQYTNYAESVCGSKGVTPLCRVCGMPVTICICPP